MEKWDEDDLRTPVEDKNSNQALRIISSCFPFNYVQKYSLLSPQDVFVPLIKIFSLSRNCIEKEKDRRLCRKTAKTLGVKEQALLGRDTAEI